MITINIGKIIVIHARIVIFEVDVITNVSRLGRLLNKQFINKFVHFTFMLWKFRRNTEDNKHSAEKGWSYIRSI